MKNHGYVSLHRSINDNPLWLAEPFTKAQAWIDLFLNANWKDSVIYIRGNMIEIKRGQLGWSELTMAKRWRWSRTKVRRFLSYLEGVGNVIQQKSKLTTIITICNYNKFQQDKTTDDTTDDTTERQQKDNRKTTDDTQVNKVNKVNKESKTIVEQKTLDAVREIISYLNAKTGKRFNAATKTTIGHINARMGEGATLEDFKTAIDNQVREWLGTKDEKYLRPATLFNSDKFDGYVNATAVVEKNDVQLWPEFDGSGGYKSHAA